jgi:hypothetical protein
LAVEKNPQTTPGPIGGMETPQTPFLRLYFFAPLCSLVPLGVLFSAGGPSAGRGGSGEKRPTHGAADRLKSRCCMFQCNIHTRAQSKVLHASVLASRGVVVVESWQVASCRSYLCSREGGRVPTPHPPLGPLRHNANPRDGALGISRYNPGAYGRECRAPNDRPRNVYGKLSLINPSE